MGVFERITLKKTFGLGLLALTLGISMLPLDGLAIEPLKGSATITRPSRQVKTFVPTSKSAKRADVLAEQYKLDAAEARLRKILQTSPNNAAAHNALGKVFYYRTTSNNQAKRDQTHELLRSAESHFNKAIGLQPGYVDARLNLGTIYMEQGRIEDAAEQFERAYSQAPNNPDVLERMGALQVERGSDNDALSFLKQAVAHKTRNNSVHYYLGRVYVNRGEWDKAHKELTTSLYQFPNSAPAHFEMGRLYESQGNDAAAINEYQKALRIKPELTEASEKLSSLYEGRGDYPQSLEASKNIVDSASKSQPASWESVDKVGKLSLKNQQPDIAIQYYRKWMFDHPGEHEMEARTAISNAQATLAKVKKRDDDLVSQGEAREQAEQALAYNPNNFEAKLIETKLDKTIGKANGAAYRADGKPHDPRFIDVALAHVPVEPNQAFKQGELLLYRYQFDQADSSFRAARRSAKTSREALVFGELFLEKSLPQMAEECFRHVLQFLPGNESAQLGLTRAQQAKAKSDQMMKDARYAKKEGSTDLAIRHAESAIKYNVKNVQAHYWLGKWYEDRENYAQAADHYYAYVQLSPLAEDRQTVERRIEHLKGRMLKASR